MKKTYLTPNVLVKRNDCVDVILSSNVDFSDIWGTSGQEEVTI